MAKVDTRSHKHFVWDASVSTVLHPFVDQAPQESFLQREGNRCLIPAAARFHRARAHTRAHARALKISNRIIHLQEAADLR